jgi:hypothetical protein
VEAQRQEREQAEQVKAQINAGLMRSKPVYTGRGGVGNWNQDAAHASQLASEEEEKQKADAVRAKVLEDVEAGLKPPAPAYHQTNRDTT